MKTLVWTFKEITDNLFLIRMIARFDIKKRYSTTLMGFSWVIINPLITLLIYWFVFSVGLKVQPTGGVPFVLYFLAAMSAWSFFSESVNGNSSIIIANKHLVTKTKFPTLILIIATMVTGLIGHGVSLGLLIVLMYAMDFSFSVSMVQIVPYFVLLCMISAGLGWIVASLNVFFRDVAEVTRIMLNLWFWATPIVWNPQSIPEQFLWVLEVNPMAIVTRGYVDSALYGVWFWQDLPRFGMIFLFASVVFFLGALLFRNLNEQFAEVL